MIATYNARAVRVLMRSESRRRGPWQFVPDLSWLLLIDALVLQTLAIVGVSAGKLKLHAYLPAIHSGDALTILAITSLLLSLVVTARAKWLTRNHSSASGKTLNAVPATTLPPSAATGIALQHWVAAKLNSTAADFTPKQRARQIKPTFTMRSPGGASPGHAIQSA